MRHRLLVENFYRVPANFEMIALSSHSTPYTPWAVHWGVFSSIPPIWRVLRGAWLAFCGAVAFCGLSCAAVTLDSKPVDAGGASWDPDVAREPVATRFNGSFIGIEAGGTVSALEWARPDDSLGGGGFVSGRVSLVLYLMDVGLSYRLTRYGLADRLSSGNVDRHSWVGSFKLHPLFATLVRGAMLDHILASSYVELGLGAEYALWEPTQPTGSSDGAGVVVELGAGFDVPVGIPSGEDSFWVGLGYKKSWVTLDLNRGPQLDDWDEHVFYVRVGYRMHGVDVGRVPRPTEMQFR